MTRVNVVAVLVFLICLCFPFFVVIGENNNDNDNDNDNDNNNVGAVVNNVNDDDINNKKQEYIVSAAMDVNMDEEQRNHNVVTTTNEKHEGSNDGELFTRFARIVRAGRRRGRRITRRFGLRRRTRPRRPSTRRRPRRPYRRRRANVPRRRPQPPRRRIRRRPVRRPRPRRQRGRRIARRRRRNNKNGCRNRDDCALPSKRRRRKKRQKDCRCKMGGANYNMKDFQGPFDWEQRQSDPRAQIQGIVYVAGIYQLGKFHPKYFGKTLNSFAVRYNAKSTEIPSKTRIRRRNQLKIFVRKVKNANQCERGILDTYWFSANSRPTCNASNTRAWCPPSAFVNMAKRQACL